MHSIMPVLDFRRDREGNAWAVRNTGRGTAEEIFFAELDDSGSVKNYVELDPMTANEKLLFKAEKFSHCIKLMAVYKDTAGRRYFSECSQSRSKHRRARWRSPLRALGIEALKPTPEADLRGFILRA